MSREADNSKTTSPPASVGRPNTKPTTPPGAGGFTLVELLVVVAIISLLLLIGAPSALVIQRGVGRGLSQTTLTTIEVALELYHGEFEDLPPSNPRGAETICRLLTGYLPDLNNDQTPGEGNGAEADDGYDGYGFRLTAHGPKCGPYGGAERLNWEGGGGGGGGAGDAESGARFVDYFGHAVLYYLYDPEAQVSQRYNPHDNTEGPNDINDYATSSSNQYYRKDFLLMTMGPDAGWTKPRDGGDDITNFR